MDMDFSDVTNLYDAFFNEMRPTITPSDIGLGIVSSFETPLEHEGQNYFIQFRHERKLPSEPAKKSVGYSYSDLIDSDYIIMLEIETTNPLKYVGEYMTIGDFAKKYSVSIDLIEDCFNHLHKDLASLDKWLQTATSLYHDRMVDKDWTKENIVVC